MKVKELINQLIFLEELGATSVSLQGTELHSDLYCGKLSDLEYSKALSLGLTTNIFGNICSQNL